MAVMSTEAVGMSMAVCIGLMATTATESVFIIRPRRSSMSRLHRRASVSFSHPSIFIPDPDKWDKSRHAGYVR